MKFLKIKNSANKAEIYINGDIVDDSWNYNWDDDPSIYPLDIKKMLDDYKDKDVDVHINSGGGDVFAGIGISNMLKQHKGKTTAYIDGIAGSIASVIAFGCNEIVMPSNAFLMVHKPYTFAMGNANDLAKVIETLDTIQQGIVNTYLDHTKEDYKYEDINKLVDDETWLTGDKASEYFDIILIDSLKVVNCTSNLYKNFKSVPKEIVQEETSKEDENTVNLELLNKKIDLSLAL